MSAGTEIGTGAGVTQADANRGHRDHGPPTRFELDDRSSLELRSGWPGRHPDPHRDSLLDARPLDDLDRPRQRERPAVGLVTGVDPVSLVFGFENVAVELERDRDAVDVVAQRRQSGKSGDRLLLGDERREPDIAIPAFGIARASRNAGAFANRVDGTQPDPIGGEIGLSHA